MKKQTYKPLIILKRHEFAGLTVVFEGIFEDRFINACLSKLYTKNLLDPETYYPVDVELYASQSGLPIHIAYMEIKELVYKFRKMSYELMDEVTKVVLNIPLLHNFSFCDETKSISVQWTADVIPFISGKMPFGQFSYYDGHFSSVSSHITYTLLEYLQRNLYLLKMNKPVFLETEELRRLTKTENIYKEYKELNRRVVKPALDSFFKLTGIELTCKGGKHSVTFSKKVRTYNQHSEDL